MPRGPKGNGQTRRVSSTNSPRAGPLLVTSMRRRDHARRVFLAVSWVTDLGCHRVKKERGVRTWRQVLPGHWEGDLLSGPNNSYIATLVERQPSSKPSAHSKNPSHSQLGQCSRALNVLIEYLHLLLARCEANLKAQSGMMAFCRRESASTLKVTKCCEWCRCRIQTNSGTTRA